jgi:Tol biopolymer transport system component
MRRLMIIFAAAVAVTVRRIVWTRRSRPTSGRRGKLGYAYVASVVAVATIACSSCGVSHVAAAGSASSTPASGAAATSVPLSSLPGEILFTRAGGSYGDETIFTAGADGSHARRITAFGATCCPRWSPDGTHILIAAQAPDGRITTGIINPDGSHKRILPLPSNTLNLGASAWSPDGSRMALEGWSDKRPGFQGIYVAGSSDGGGLVRITHCLQSQDDRPMGWSADGSKIFFFRAVARFPTVTDEPLGSVYVVNVDGTHPRRVTPANLRVEVAGNAGGKVSADGAWIVFTSSGVIWKIRTDGSDLTKVYQDPKGRLAITPTWSPDGRFILFGLDPTGSLAVVSTAPANGLYVIRADGTGLTPVIVSNDWKREPDWAATKA